MLSEPEHNSSRRGQIRYVVQCYLGTVLPTNNDPKRGPGFARSITGCAVCSAAGTPNCNKLSVRMSFVEDLFGGAGVFGAMGGKRGANRI